MATKTPKPDTPTPTNPDMAAMVEAQAQAQTQVDERPVMAEPEGGWPADEFTGKPGSYVRDPYTGIRSPAAE